MRSLATKRRGNRPRQRKTDAGGAPPGPPSPLASAFRSIRRRLGESQGTFAEKLHIEKSLVSKLENGRRTPSRDVLRSLIARTDLTSAEREELQNAAKALILGAEDREQMVVAEARQQVRYQEVHVVAERPLEIMDTKDANPFLQQMLADFRKLDEGEAPRYTYWTAETTLDAFRVFFVYFGSELGWNHARLDEVFQVIVAPPELTLLSYAVYRRPQQDAEVMPRQEGRILLSEGDMPAQSSVSGMDSRTLERVSRLLSLRLDQLGSGNPHIHPPGYTMYSPSELLTGRKKGSA
jgi:transcriptional regulator with XRE-family HTH domain